MATQSLKKAGFRESGRPSKLQVAFSQKNGVVNSDTDDTIIFQLISGRKLLLFKMPRD